MPGLGAVAPGAGQGTSLKKHAHSNAGPIVNGEGVDIEYQASSIFKWYRSDFGNTDAALIEHWRGYAEADLALQLSMSNSRITIRYDYDWDLNE